MWWNYPKTMYCIFFIIDLALIGFAFVTMKGMWDIVGIFFGIQEVFVFIWHFIQFFLFVDFFKGDFPGDGKMSDKASKFWSTIAMISVLVSFIFEIGIWVLAILAHKKGGKKGDESSSLELDIAESGTELNHKIATFKTMKMKKNEDQNAQAQEGDVEA